MSILNSNIIMKNIILLLLVCVFAACNTGDKQKTGESTTATTQTATTTPAKPAKPTPQATAAKGAVKWLTWEEAVKMNKANPKKILVDVYTSWCGPCKMMDRMTFADAGVADYVNTNFYPVKFNAESPGKMNYKGKEYSNPKFRSDVPPNRRNSAHQLVSVFGVRGYPSLVVLDGDMNIKSKLVGFKKPNQLMGELTKL